MSSFIFEVPRVKERIVETLLKQVQKEIPNILTYEKYRIHESTVFCVEYDYKEDI